VGYFANPEASLLLTPRGVEGGEAGESEENLDLPLEEFGLSTRVLHGLNVRPSGLNLEDLRNISGIGERGLEEICQVLAKKGFTLKFPPVALP